MGFRDKIKLAFKQRGLETYEYDIEECERRYGKAASDIDEELGMTSIDNMFSDEKQHEAQQKKEAAENRIINDYMAEKLTVLYKGQKLWDSQNLDRITESEIFQHAIHDDLDKIKFPVEISADDFTSKYGNGEDYNEDNTEYYNKLYGEKYNTYYEQDLIFAEIEDSDRGVKNIGAR